MLKDNDVLNNWQHNNVLPH